MDEILGVPTKKLEQFCHRWQIQRLELFGSALGGAFTRTSDVDLLVEFDPGFHRTLGDQIKMQQELEALFGRDVDFIVRKTIESSPNPHKRANILNDTRVIYVEG